MALLELDDLSLSPGGKGLSMALEPGRSLAVVGPAGSGKSLLLQCLLGQQRPARGAAHLRADAVVADLGAMARRTTPQTIGRRVGAGPAGVAEALSALRLWSDRFKPLRELTPGQRAACAVLEALCSPQKLIVIDGYLDQLDPWALDGARRMIKDRLGGGASLVLATNRPDLASRQDLIVVLNELENRFSGTVADLRRGGPMSKLEVRTNNVPGARAVADPFEVTFREIEGGLEISARDGQQVAARLVLEGYNDVRLISLRDPSVEEALLSLMA